MMRSVSSLFPSSFPGFLASRFILDHRIGADFVPAGIVGEGTGWDLLALNQFSRCVFWRQRGWDRFARASGKFLRKFFNKTLGRPGTRFAKRADGSSGNIVADCLQCARIFRDPAAI